MGQKINANIFRLGIKKTEWKTKYFSKNHEEFSLNTYQSIEIKNFCKKFLINNGLILHDFKLHYSGTNIYLFISYYTTKKSFFFLSKTNTKQEIKLKKYKLIKKIKSNKKTNFNIKNKCYFSTEINYKNTKKNLKKRIRVLKKYKKKFTFQNNKNKKHLIYNNFSEQLLESLSAYTNKKFNIFLTFQNLNKGLSLNLNKTQTKFLKKKSLELRHMSKNKFFKETINILIISLLKKNSAQLLAEYIAQQLKFNKRHNFFLIFIKRVLHPLISKKKLSNISGIKFTIKGRFNGAPRANKKTYEFGVIPLQTIISNIDYYQATSYTKNGTFGVKVWICQN